MGNSLTCCLGPPAAPELVFAELQCARSELPDTHPLITPRQALDLTLSPSPTRILIQTTSTYWGNVCEQEDHDTESSDGDAYGWLSVGGKANHESKGEHKECRLDAEVEALQTGRRQSREKKQEWAHARKKQLKQEKRNFCKEKKEQKKAKKHRNKHSSKTKTVRYLG
jgi:hypothetical protein